MRYLIDGYNLIHSLGLLAAEARPGQLRRARTALLDRLLRLPAAQDNQFLVVFDACRTRDDSQEIHEIRSISVVYSHDRPADDWIIRYLTDEPRRHDLAVVSDDRRIHAAARRRGCKFLRCVEFLAACQTSAALPQPLTSRKPDEKPSLLSAEEIDTWLDEFDGLNDQPESNTQP